MTWFQTDVQQSSLPRHHLHRELCAEIPHEDEIGEGEVGVVEKVVELSDEMHSIDAFDKSL